MVQVLLMTCSDPNLMYIGSLCCRIREAQLRYFASIRSQLGFLVVREEKHRFIVSNEGHWNRHKGIVQYEVT